MASKPEEYPTSVLLIPFMSPGHIIPMIDMAKLLANRRLHVTIIVTHLHATRFSPVIDRAVDSGLPIRLLQIRFPCEDAGLPSGCESADLLPSYDLMPNFFAATDMLQKPLEQILTDLDPAPACIICDKHLPWTADTCDGFKIPRIIFDGMSCFTGLVTHNLNVSKIHEAFPPDTPFAVPGLPEEIHFTRQQLPGLFNPGSTTLAGFRQRVMETESRAHGLVVNTFEGLEYQYVEELRRVGDGRVWCVGPLSLSGNGDLDRIQRGNHASSADYDRCLKWLDGRESGSVVYACLGSLGRLSVPQFSELALGLEASQHPFILVIQGGRKTSEIERWIGEEGIEERCRERGLLLRGWAPQVAILSHAAVGAFLSHCGWNSTLEGISAGVAMVTWPIFADQFLNEKLVAEVVRTGVGVGARRVVYLGEEEKGEVEVKRDGVAEGVRRVMDDDERKERAKKFGEMAGRSVEEGGSSWKNVTMLVTEIERLKKINCIAI